MSNYSETYNLIVSYIKQTLKSEKQINEYVPNSHIADTFKDVLIYLELEDMFPIEFHDEHTCIGSTWSSEKGEEKTINQEKSNYHILKYLETGDYFNQELLIKNGSEEIHRVYQKLRNKYDEIRNTMKIVNISLSDYIMVHLNNRDLKSHKIKIK